MSKNILFKKEYIDLTLRNPKTNRCLKIDFMILDKDKKPLYAIEYNGAQHTNAFPMFGGEEGLDSTKYRDGIKRQWLKEKNIPLLDISYKQLNSIDKILESWCNNMHI